MRVGSESQKYELEVRVFGCEKNELRKRTSE